MVLLLLQSFAMKLFCLTDCSEKALAWLKKGLDFRPDLQRGDKGIIYAELARLLRSGPRVMKKGFCKNDLFRWFSDPRHSNLGTNLQSIQRAVYQHIEDVI